MSVGAVTASAARSRAGGIDALATGLATAPVDGDAAGLVDEITALERLQRSIAARQARLTVAFDTDRRRQQEGAGVPREKLGRGVADQIALARRESPRRGQQHLGLAKVLVHEMPCTLAALERGDVSEWGATCVARETACLTLDDRREVDTRLAPTLAQQGVSEKQLARAARALAQQLDPAAAVKRAARAEADRCVTVRPAPDCMVHVTAHLPAHQGVAVYATLDRMAKAATAQGDPRGRGQVMADTLVTLVTDGAASTRAPGATPITVELVISDTTLLGDDDAPALVPGHGPVPAAVARRLVADATAADRAWVRRLYATPDRTRLVAMESRSRLFPTALARFIRLGDQVCATPWCDAPARHTDHVTPVRTGGTTSAANGQSLCEHCNLAKEHTGSTTHRDGPTTTLTTTTGHRYEGTAPPLLGLPPPSPLEITMRRALAVA